MHSSRISLLLLTGFLFAVLCSPSLFSLASDSPVAIKLPEFKAEYSARGNVADLDLGVLKRGNKYALAVEITNNGEKQIIVQSVVASCGCTNAKVNGKGIAEIGETLVLSVDFDANGNEGEFSSEVVLLDSSERSGSEEKTPIFKLRFRGILKSVAKLTQSQFEVEKRGQEQAFDLLLQSPFEDVSFEGCDCLVVCSRVSHFEIVEKEAKSLKLKITAKVDESDFVHEQVGHVKLKMASTEAGAGLLEIPFRIVGPPGLRVLTGSAKFTRNDGLLTSKFFLRGMIDESIGINEEIPANIRLVSSLKDSEPIELQSKLTQISKGLFLAEISLEETVKEPEFWTSKAQIFIHVRGFVVSANVVLY